METLSIPEESIEFEDVSSIERLSDLEFLKKFSFFNSMEVEHCIHMCCYGENVVVELPSISEREEWLRIFNQYKEEDYEQKLLEKGSFLHQYLT